MELTRSELERWVAILEAHEAQELERASQAGGLPVLDYTERPPPVPAEVMQAIARARSPEARNKTVRALADLDFRISRLRSLVRLLVAREASSFKVVERLEALKAEARRIRETLYL